MPKRLGAHGDWKICKRLRCKQSRQVAIARGRIACKKELTNELREKKLEAEKLTAEKLAAENLAADAAMKALEADAAGKLEAEKRIQAMEADAKRFSL